MNIIDTRATATVAFLLLLAACGAKSTGAGPDGAREPTPPEESTETDEPATPPGAGLTRAEQACVADADSDFAREQCVSPVNDGRCTAAYLSLQGVVETGSSDEFFDRCKASWSVADADCAHDAADEDEYAACFATDDGT
jgi:hypothetical protein